MFVVLDMRNRTIEVLDSIMGSGKTTGIIKWMNKNPNRKYLYVSPLLTEVEDRIPDECAPLGFISPNINEHRTKGEHLLELLKDGCNVSFTHKLFTDLTSEHLKIIESQRYTLIVDEEIDFIEAYSGKDYSSADILTLEKSGHVYIDEDNLGKLVWKWNKEHFEESSTYSKLKRMCDLGMLHCAKRDRAMMVLHLPLRLLEVTDRCIVMTYMFKGSVMDRFMNLKGVTVKDFTEIDLLKTEAEVKLNASKLINLNTTPSISKVRKYRLSSTWYNSVANSDQLKAVESAIRSGCRKSHKSCTVFTLPKEIVLPTKGKPKIRVRSYSSNDCFLYCGTKATNDYVHITNMVYAYNRYPHVSISAYLNDYGFPVDEDQFALSEMIQWVWRSAIREGKPITLSILPLRMLRLFTDWLNHG